MCNAVSFGVWYHCVYLSAKVRGYSSFKSHDLPFFVCLPVCCDSEGNRDQRYFPMYSRVNQVIGLTTDGVEWRTAGGMGQLERLGVGGLDVLSGGLSVSMAVFI